ncbi:MAG: UDP-2,4-diacetamido-2,4,6-trideoxy-beta-L-altropyranose hydrolase [Sulfuritalea sp.]|nr:UDP-2,4-diacetamido-2,4,6-trideoxy-beta-L-altropyranose hydrolase [Sulfuritalea sp.]
MNVAIRTDATPQIGTGHVMRCLTLADVLSTKGVAVSFLCCELPLHLEELITSKGHKFMRMDAARDDAEETRMLLKSLPVVDWLVVDHYGLDAGWETAVRPAVKGIVVIDDLANRSHDCDVLLDSTFGEDGCRYRGLIPATCRKLFGATYVLLRPQFAEARKRRLLSPNDGELVAHVFFGGSDLRGYTSRFAQALASRLPHLRQEIAVGALYPDTDGLGRLQREFPGRIVWQREVDDMAAHMSRCSVALGAPGIATWERACLGLPSAYLATHHNQRPILQALEKRGLCRFLGDADLITDDAFIDGVREFLADTRGLAGMREIGLSAIDGNGAERVAHSLLGTE